MSDAIHNFLALEPKHARYDTARFAFLPIPFDGCATYLRGGSKGPAAIIEASAHMEDFDPEFGAEFHDVGIATLNAIDIDSDNAELTQQRIFEAAARIVADGKFPFGLGGDHSVSAPLIRATMTEHAELTVLQLDAHTDLRDSYDGTDLSHASVMRRVFEMGARIVPVGIRSLPVEDHRFARENHIELVSAAMCRTDSDWIDRVVGRLGETVYVTIDIDVFDPAYAPGTGTPEPGGLDWFAVTALLRRVAAERHIIGADIVEVMPISGQVVTEFLAARLAYKLIAYICAAQNLR